MTLRETMSGRINILLIQHHKLRYSDEVTCSGVRTWVDHQEYATYSSTGTPSIWKLVLIVCAATIAP